MCPGVGPEGWLKGLPTPLMVLCAGGMRCTLLLLPTPCFCSRLFRSGRWGFGLILSPRICPDCTCMHLFLVPYSFFVFCCSRRPLFRCKLCSKGFQPVSLRCSGPTPLCGFHSLLSFSPRGRACTSLFLEMSPPPSSFRSPFQRPLRSPRRGPPAHLPVMRGGASFLIPAVLPGGWRASGQGAGLGQRTQTPFPPAHDCHLP